MIQLLQKVTNVVTDNATKMAANSGVARGGLPRSGLGNLLLGPAGYTRNSVVQRLHWGNRTSRAVTLETQPKNPSHNPEQDHAD